MSYFTIPDGLYVTSAEAGDCRGHFGPRDGIVRVLNPGQLGLLHRSRHLDLPLVGESSAKSLGKKVRLPHAILQHKSIGDCSPDK